MNSENKHKFLRDCFLKNVVINKFLGNELRCLNSYHQRLLEEIKIQLTTLKKLQ